MCVHIYVTHMYIIHSEYMCVYVHTYIYFYIYKVKYQGIPLNDDQLPQSCQKEPNVPKKFTLVRQNNYKLYKLSVKSRMYPL